MQDFTTAFLNLFGLGLQIEGVLIGVYAVRNLVFRKKTFQSNSFQSNSFQTSTISDNAPTDEKTNKKVDKVTVIDHKKAIFGVISIVVGIVFQMAAVFTTTNP